eukprot:3057593-Ditylum_brightwellii.AAC.1
MQQQRDSSGGQNSTKISTNLKEETLEVVEGTKTKAYLMDNFLLPTRAMDNVDWYAIKLACENMDFFKKRWSSRWAAEFIPTGTELEDQGTWDSAKFLWNCGEEMKTPAHVVQCTKANNLWTKIKSILVEWGQLNTARPGLMRAHLKELVAGA